MKVLVIGNGGREHAIAWKLLQSPKVKKVLCIPGNGGTTSMEGCQTLPMRTDDFEGIARFVLVQGISLVVIGPELPLSMGIADYLQQQNIKVFGPNQAGAQIESSKAWAKELMVEAGVPTAGAEVFSDAEAAKAYVSQQGAPIVVKADGLAAGKGVVVAATVEEAHCAIADLSNQGFRLFVIEEYLTGQEVSVLALSDGLTVRPLIPAQDHKQIGEGDTGANTGGMGAYAPTPIVDADCLERIEREVLQPTLATLQKRGIDYRGILYAGLKIAPDGQPKVLEFNCRFGDPETQAVLPLLETPLEQLFLACIEQRLEELPPISWKSGSAVCVVAASQGYPGSYKRGYPISGVQQATESGAIVFHAGTKIQQNQLVTDGGRVLGVTAMGETFEDAIAQAYQSIDCIEFEGIYYRKDIGHRIK
ncbi:phosphoribosylamine--glycine ligase [Lusitaniella coriacea LEGE 07157]|uniref:Phosphoribosylamine--glycine ligase n=1 Tax=Lusitaniella coriacea LEGE 07157 TaxID=945747 RepID=A0A8J7E0P7_9CYAN|nr:phosphoribosylamine--glycine ligase [Lusitaniella coriacea]MBE9118098.1 phosphoribosylamine--glycine ligase [Lusitaniella coriacea LEGE 07157]